MIFPALLFYWQHKGKRGTDVNFSGNWCEVSSSTNHSIKLSFLERRLYRILDGVAGLVLSSYTQENLL